MARPEKRKAYYYPLDIGFLQDKKIKLIKSEFGLNSIAVILAFFDAIYGRDEGYYLKWDEDECLLMSDGVGGGCTSNYVKEVLKGCIRRSLFDKGVFDMFGVITSKGIQRRYLKIFERKEKIELHEEYLLLDLASADDVPGNILNKITIKSVNVTKTPDKCNNNEGKCNNNSTKKRKENKSKEKETVKEKTSCCKSEEKEQAEPVCSNKFERIIKKWNSLGLNEIKSITSTRETLLNARIKQYGIDCVLSAVDNINKSSFLQGQNNTNWVVTFDWFIRPNNFMKVSEGNYDDKKKESGHIVKNKLNQGEITTNPGNKYNSELPEEFINKLMNGKGETDG